MGSNGPCLGIVNHTGSSVKEEPVYRFPSSGMGHSYNSISLRRHPCNPSSHIRIFSKSPLFTFMSRSALNIGTFISNMEFVQAEYIRSDTNLLGRNHIPLPNDHNDHLHNISTFLSSTSFPSTANITFSFDETGTSTESRQATPPTVRNERSSVRRYLTACMPFLSANAQSEASNTDNNEYLQMNPFNPTRSVLIGLIVSRCGEAPIPHPYFIDESQLHSDGHIIVWSCDGDMSMLFKLHLDNTYATTRIILRDVRRHLLYVIRLLRPRISLYTGRGTLSVCHRAKHDWIDDNDNLLAFQNSWQGENRAQRLSLDTRQLDIVARNGGRTANLVDSELRKQVATLSVPTIGRWAVKKSSQIKVAIESQGNWEEDFCVALAACYSRIFLQRLPGFRRLRARFDM